MDLVPFPVPQDQRVQVTLKKTSGETWIETDPLPVLCTMSYIVFDVARVDRRDSVVPYLIYDEKVQPYWKSLMQFPAVRNGCQALEMTVVLQPKETPIAVLFDKVRPLNEDGSDMSYETFKNCLTDAKDGRYMDMERLMNTVYPVRNIIEIWPWDAASLSSRSQMAYEQQGRGLTMCSNLYPVEACPVDTGIFCSNREDGASPIVEVTPRKNADIRHFFCRVCGNWARSGCYICMRPYCSRHTTRYEVAGEPVGRICRGCESSSSDHSSSDLTLV